MFEGAVSGPLRLLHLLSSFLPICYYNISQDFIELCLKNKRKSTKSDFFLCIAVVKTLRSIYWWSNSFFEDVFPFFFLHYLLHFIIIFSRIYLRASNPKVLRQGPFMSTWHRTELGSSFFGASGGRLSQGFFPPLKTS